ncbi:alpha/beta hydrolase [Sutcliffiella horikoshii]|uniref:alpha/beta fold hydrolase n=1 Tax=Sutcliffiella horikoshii TaxID=79883 RepID=UPI0007D058CA|nr:alpha/beta hydrolase [Sutcliffiella horikoshii]MCM3617229.1 alpha/beta hydrolase [Sutcliffiella horikoshii]
MEEFESTIKSDVSLFYEDKGVGQTVVLLHGFCGSHAYWKYVMDELTTYYRVIAIDLRGHGQSAVSEESFTINDMAEDVKLLLDSLEIEQASIIGHSLGGYIALSFAEKYDELTEGIGLIHSTAYPDSEESKKGREKAIQNIRANGIEDFIDELSLKLFAPQNIEAFKGEVEFTRSIGYSTKVQGAIEALEAMKNREDKTPFIKEYSKPLLLLAGKEDQIIPSEKTFLIDGEHVMKILLSKSGHMGMLEEPKVVIDALKTFLTSMKN